MNRRSQRGTPARRGGSRLLSFAWRSLPFVVFVLLALLSWRRWFLPFQDSGRDLLTADLVASGRTLYSEVGYSYGPAPAYLDAAAFRLFGRDLDVLVALRLVLALLGIEALRRLTRRVCASEAVAGGAVALAVAACCFRAGGNWLFPYSVAALEGAVGVWWALELALSSSGWAGALLAGLVAGLAGGTKLEILPAALLAIGPALFLRRPRREAAAGLALAATLGIAAFAVPMFLFGMETMGRHGFLVALSLPESWKELYREQVFFQGTSPRAFFAGGFVKVWGPSLLLFGALTAACRARIPPAWRAAALALLFLCAARLFIPREELAVLMPGAAVILAIEIVTAIERRRIPRARRLAAICVALVALMAASRQPFFLRNGVYGAFSAPLAVAAGLGWLGRRATRSHQAFALFLVALSGFHVNDRLEEWRSYEAERFEAPGMRVVLPAAEARFLRAAVAALERTTPEGSYVACFPEAGFVLFAAGRRSPFVDTVFYPDIQDAAAEEAMIRRLREAPVAALLVTNRHFGEYGPHGYRTGVLDRFFAVVDRDYQVAEVLGEESAVGAPGAHATLGTLYLPRPRRSSGQAAALCGCVRRAESGWGQGGSGTSEVAGISLRCANAG